MNLFFIAVGTSISLGFDDVHCNDNGYDNSLCNIWIFKSRYIMF